MSVWQLYGEAAKTALGFFWKSGWAFVFGYAISAMVQAFVPKKKLTRYMGRPDVKSISLAALFGAASSSCSFADLAAARSLVQKGAHFIVAVAFMFASTMILFRKKHQKLQANGHQHMNHGGGISLKRFFAYMFALLLAGGLVSYFLTN